MEITADTLQRAGLGGLDSRISRIDADTTALQGKESALFDATAAARAREKAAIEARSTELTPKLEEAANLKAPDAQLKQERSPAYQRPTLDPQDLRETFGMLTAVSMLVGAMSRTPFHNTMAAMTGAMEGFVKGDEARVKESLLAFDRNSTAIRERNAAAKAEYDAAWGKYKNDAGALQQQIKLIAAKYDDQILLAQVDRQSAGDTLKYIEQRIKQNDQLAGRLETTKANAETKLMQMEQTRALREQGLELQRQGLELKRQAQTAKAPGATENTGGLSEKYRTDPEYAKQVDFWATYFKQNKGLPPRFAQSGAGKMMFGDIVSRVPQITDDPREIQANEVALTGQKSEARALGTRSAAIEQAASEAREMSSIVLDTSSKFSRTDYQPINKVWAAYEKNTGGTEVRQFGAALNSYINAYARAVSPTGTPTVHDKEHAREMLSTADSHDQVKAILSVLDREMTAAQHSPENVKRAQREQITGRRSSDGGGDLREKVQAAGGVYEPEKYEYRVTPDGKVQRRAKGQ